MATQLDRIEEAVKTLDTKLDGFTERLVAVETNQKNARAILNWLATLVGGLILAGIGAIMSAFSSRP